MSIPSIHLGPCPQRPAGGPVEGNYVTSAGERLYRIRHVDAMPPFLMSVVGASDLWMFVSSSGGLTAGRVDADGALFPYTTVDKLTEGFDHTGPKTVLRVTRNGRTSLWEPFSERGHGIYRVERNLDKSVLGHEVRFHEINHDLGLGFTYVWRGSDAYGFVRTSSLTELASAPCAVELLDGLQNLLPAGATAPMQGGLSNLLDAYKRNELESSTGLGLFTLSSTLTDLAEPSESLLATTVFALGLEGAGRLLSSVQLERFRRGGSPVTETDVRGRRGAYFVHADLALSPGETRSWHLVADVGRDHARVVALSNALRADASGLEALVEADVRRSGEALAAIVASADGFQWTRDPLAADHHLASVLFNVMRGGVFLDDDLVPRADLIDFVRTRQRALLEAHGAFFDGLPASLPRRALVERAATSGAPDLERVCSAYLPLAFSRRHGDPSRPWNRFTINVRHPDGRPRLDHQGNWRDIFQNWEALAHAFPGFVTGMIGVFLGATTADGYNPYRVTRDGIEWEAPEPGHPWSNIGYWSDHQVVYLQKLLETAARFDPGALDALLDRRVFSHANVPYRIRPYEAMLDDPYDTIVFDADLDRRIEAAVATEGTDARLLKGPDGAVFHVSMAEKLLLTLLVKLANLVPEGGIWMNTQRPEWNDANNALVGKGLSVVTTAYLYGFVVFLQELLAGRPAVGLTQEVRSFFDAVHEGLRAHAGRLDASFDDRDRRAFMDTLGAAGSAYRRDLYERGVSGAWTELDSPTLTAFLELARTYLEHTLRANRRPDALYHAYNVLALDGAAGAGAAGAGRATIRRLDEMLEGQVAILSSGLLSAGETLDLLASLRRGPLYRTDQHSYILYPDRDLPGFLAKNRIPPERVRASRLLTALVDGGDARLVDRDANGDVRFHGGFRNAKGVRRALAELGDEDAWAALVAAEGEGVAALFEEVFDHASFTGRSGTFFAYEGLGSIYWHMVSKLLLAVQGCYHRAGEAGEPPELVASLAAAYDDVRAGLGFHKTPAEFGAFPTDPYSHTPAHAGAQQPGMTGQVKEDVLARLGELGVEVRGGQLGFAPSLLGHDEFLDEPLSVTVRGVGGPVDLTLERGTIGFTFCQVPVVYLLADGAAPVTAERHDGLVRAVAGAFLDPQTSREVFERTGAVTRIEVTVPVSALRSQGAATTGGDRAAASATDRSEPAMVSGPRGARP